MVILFLSNANSVHTVRWVNSLVEKGHEVHLASILNHANKNVDIIDKRVKVYTLKYSGQKGYYLNLFQLQKIYNNIRPDIVNAHYASGYGTLARVARLKPLILSVWGSDVYDFPYKNKFNMKLIKKNLEYADKIASTSYCMADQVRKLLNDETIDIAITPFGVDLNRFCRIEEYRKDDYIYIGITKALSPKYGVIELINAIKTLKSNLDKQKLSDLSSKIRLLIYGDGEQKEEIVRLIRYLNLQETVELKGKIPNTEIPKILQKLDIFCATSIANESFGVAVVEAMAMELPVVVTDTDGFKEIVQDGVTGIIVKRNDITSISDALKILILNKTQRKHMGIKGRLRVIKLYNWEENVDTMVKLYHENRLNGSAKYVKL